MSNYPFHFQSAVYDCVPMCVLSLSEYYNVDISLKSLRELLVTDPNLGTSIKNLQRLHPYFMVQLGKMTNIADISNLFPFVAYLNRAHAVIAWGFSEKGNFIIGDPGIGVIEISKEEFLRQWDGLAAIIRPHESHQVENKQPEVKPKGLLDRLGTFRAALRYLDVKWNSSLWLSFIIIILGVANSYYSLEYVKYLSDYWTFIILVLSYTTITGLINWISSLVEARLSLRFSQELGWKIREALPFMDRRFYTMGDVSTRYQDAAMVISSIMGLYRDIPYAIIIFGASLFFLWKISWLLSIFVLSFLVLLISMMSPFVKKVQNISYTIKIKDAELTNKLKNYLSGLQDDVTSAYEETLFTRYKQSIWSIPISSTVGNSAVLPVLFVVVFLHWKSGGSTQYQELLSALMIMNYAVSAGHTLYGRFVAWQTSQPSFHRLNDFLEIDKSETREGTIVS